ncbi:hypothetical protein SAMN04488104_100377 [Algoriphagus faecimaris]|uniref:Uncharacterized protein n=1 Tax=Algoriphagus faecimaris TaxID=686796 RepID=A0A1G6NE89_9BACT|nr:hypothetical protein SAMN04488104_100377 [Algoriphagus faecimaris]
MESLLRQSLANLKIGIKPIVTVYYFQIANWQALRFKNDGLSIGEDLELFASEQKCT